MQCKHVGFGYRLWEALVQLGGNSVLHHLKNEDDLSLYWGVILSSLHIYPYHSEIGFCTQTAQFSFKDVAICDNDGKL